LTNQRRPRRAIDTKRELPRPDAAHPIHLKQLNPVGLRRSLRNPLSLEGEGIKRLILLPLTLALSPRGEGIFNYSKVSIERAP